MKDITIRHLITRSHEVSKLRDLCLELSNRSEIYDRHLSSSASEPLAKFQSDMIIQSLSWLWNIMRSFHKTSNRIFKWDPGPRFNIKVLPYRYRKSHCGDKMVVRSSYLHNGISYTGKIASLYWFSPLIPNQHCPKADQLTLLNPELQYK